VASPASKLAHGVVDAQVRVPDIYKPAVAALRIGVGDRVGCVAPANDGLERPFAAIGHYFRGDAVVVLEDAEDDGLRSTGAALASAAVHTPRPEVCG
jgi:hypothetical protein